LFRRSSNAALSFSSSGWISEMINAPVISLGLGKASLHAVGADRMVKKAIGGTKETMARDHCKTVLGIVIRGRRKNQQSFYIIWTIAAITLMRNEMRPHFALRNRHYHPIRTKHGPAASCQIKAETPKGVLGSQKSSSQDCADTERTTKGES
jgi:hypothetical protein